MSKGRPSAQIEVGSRFGKWVTTDVPSLRMMSTGRRQSYVKVECDCGSTSVVRVAALKNGSSTSCGRCPCGHPECTGVHNANRWHELCPAAKVAIQGKRKVFQAGWRKDRLVSRYVYAILVNDVALKIGTSTHSHDDQLRQTRGAFGHRGFGHADSVVMLLDFPGDHSLEIYLHWRAGRRWQPMHHYYGRHSEWFDVTGVTPQDVIKHLRRWYHQIELLDQWDAEQEAGDHARPTEARPGTGPDLLRSGHELPVGDGLVAEEGSLPIPWRPQPVDVGES